MKIQTILAFILFTLFFACKEEPKTQQNQNNKKNEAQTKTQTPKDTLFEIKYNTGTILSTTLHEPDVILVGVLHFQSPTIQGVHPDYVERYDEFWGNYLQKNPFLKIEDLVLAIECSPRKPEEIGKIAKANKELGFLTKKMFQKGIKKIIMDDTRLKLLSEYEIRKEAADFFKKRGGKFEINDVHGFPQVKITKEPELTEDDLRWLKNEWYGAVYVEDLVYEEKLYEFINLYKIKVVVGAAHIFRMREKYKLPTAFICGIEELKSTALSVKILTHLAERVERQK